MLVLITQVLSLFVIGMFMFFATMDLCAAVDRAWCSALAGYSHRHDYWVMEGDTVKLRSINNR